LVSVVNPPPIPGDAQTIGELLQARAATMPTAEALVDPHVRLTFAEVDRLTQRWSAAFAAQGLLPGDRIAVSLPNGVSIALSFLAAQRGGFVWVGINRAYTLVEQRDLLIDCGAQLLLTNGVHGFDASMPNRIDPESAEWLTLVATAPQVDDAVIDPVAPAAIAYTSGTTGTPKGVVHTQRNILLPGAVAQWRGDGAGRIGMYLPMTSLNMQVLGTVFALVNGECLICIVRSDVATVVAAVRDERINRLSASPTTVHDILDDPSIAASALGRLSDLTLGGAPTNPALEPKFRARFGQGFLSGYGLTEAPASVTRVRPGGPARPGSSGSPLPQYAIDIVDEEGVVLPSGDVGEICVRASDSGPLAGMYTPMLGYWRRPEATAAALRGGRLHTGDFGWLDDDGELYVVDRRVDLIVRGGSNVYPAEVERVLEADARISECVVVGRADARLGQVPVAFVRTAPGAVITAAEVLAIAGDSLARFKVPVSVEFVTDMPRNQMGKVLRNELRARLAVPPSPAATVATVADTVGR
jgi:long-chain acyl-CoA synthetase